MLLENFIEQQTFFGLGEVHGVEGVTDIHISAVYYMEVFGILRVFLS